MPEVAPLKRNPSRTFITLKYLIYAVSFLDEIFWLLAFFCIENNVTARRRNLMGSSLTAQ